MPLLISGLIGALLTFAASMVGRVLLALGLGYVTYSGFDVAIDYLKTNIMQNFAGMPSEIVSFLAWLWVDKAIGLLFSSYTVAVTFKLAGATVLRKLVQK